MLSHLCLAHKYCVQTPFNTIWDPHSVHQVSPPVYICKAAGTVAPVLAKITASYREAHGVLYQVGRKLNLKHCIDILMIRA